VRQSGGEMMTAFNHQASRNELLHICYQAVRAAAAVHNPYADPQAIALVGETLAEKIEGWLTTDRKVGLVFQASDADNYDYFCCILDEIHKQLPITQHFNVILHVERLTLKEQPQHAPTAIDRGGQGGSEDLDL
jgi:hypothetical protein